jgi:hypothetical protein
MWRHCGRCALRRGKWQGFFPGKPLLLHIGFSLPVTSDNQGPMRRPARRDARFLSMDRKETE